MDRRDDTRERAQVNETTTIPMKRLGTRRRQSTSFGAETGAQFGMHDVGRNRSPGLSIGKPPCDVCPGPRQVGGVNFGARRFFCNATLSNQAFEGRTGHLLLVVAMNSSSSWARRSKARKS